MAGATCPNCGEANRAEARYCARCGEAVPVTPAPAPPDAAPTPAAAPAKRRRLSGAQVAALAVSAGAVVALGVLLLIEVTKSPKPTVPEARLFDVSGRADKIIYVVDKSRYMDRRGGVPALGFKMFLVPVLCESIRGLRPEQSCQVICYETGPIECPGGLRPANDLNKDRVVAWLSRQEAGTVTPWDRTGNLARDRMPNVDSALARAALSEGGPPDVIFLVSSGSEGGLRLPEVLASSNGGRGIRINVIEINQQRSRWLVEAAEKTGGIYRCVTEAELAAFAQAARCHERE